MYFSLCEHRLIQKYYTNIQYIHKNESTHYLYVRGLRFIYNIHNTILYTVYTYVPFYIDSRTNGNFPVCILLEYLQQKKML